MKCDVAIVGAGPAGLNAAASLAGWGLSVVVLDEYFRPGGRLLGQRYDVRQHGHTKVWDGMAVAAELERKARAAGAVIRCGTSVWDIEPGWKLQVAPGPEQTIEADALIVATGAIENALPVPGWTLPGVMTVGAAQTFTTVHKVAPGERVLVAGLDALALAVTGELANAGVKVVGVVLPPPNVFSGALANRRAVVGSLMSAAGLAPSRLLRWAGWFGRNRLVAAIAPLMAGMLPLRVWGVPLRFGKALVEVRGESAVESAVLRGVDSRGRARGRPSEVAVDAVCICGGLSPLTDAARLVGCPTVELETLGGVVPIHNARMETPVDRLFLAGNITGIEGAPVAIAQGRVAAASAARALGAGPPGGIEAELAAALQEVVDARAALPFHFISEIAAGREAMERVWAGAEAPVVPVPEPDTRAGAVADDLVVCRCEEVRYQDLAEQASDWASAVPGVKKRSRACMGTCQGRVCESAVRKLGRDRSRQLFPAQRARSPLRPTRVGELVPADSVERE